MHSSNAVEDIVKTIKPLVEKDMHQGNDDNDQNILSLIPMTVLDLPVY